eukprot:scaffold25203_cov118-Isochrysis_galbana.AAC.2
MLRLNLAPSSHVAESAVQAARPPLRAISADALATAPTLVCAERPTPHAPTLPVAWPATDMVALRVVALPAKVAATSAALLTMPSRLETEALWMERVGMPLILSSVTE